MTTSNMISTTGITKNHGNMCSQKEAMKRRHIMIMVFTYICTCIHMHL